MNPAYTVVDLAGRLALPTAWAGGAGLARLGLDLRVNNLFDEQYTTFGYVDGEPLYIPAAGRQRLRGTDGGVLGTYAASLQPSAFSLQGLRSSPGAADG